MKRKQLPSAEEKQKPKRLISKKKKLKPKLQKDANTAEDEDRKISVKEMSPKESETAQTEPEGGKKPKRKQKLQDAEQDEAADAEQQRRALQRDIQQLVMRLRSEGKTSAEIKAATRELKAKSEWSKEKPPKVKKKEKQRLWEESAAQKRKQHLQKQHDLVIIPVVWRGRHDKLDVVKAAEDIKACLSQQGLDVWMDSRRHLTPGQKFAHWEHRGVLLRIEIGPEDLKAGVCQVCLAHTPGDYKSVERKRVSLPPSGTRTLLLRLKEWGLKQLEIEKRAGDSEEEDEDAPKKEAGQDKTQAAKASTPSAAEDVEGNWSPRVQEKVKGSKAGKRRKKV